MESNVSLGVHILCLMIAIQIFIIISFVNSQNTEFNVLSYGAIGNGKKDDSEAFLTTWNAACNSTQGESTVVIPKGKTFLVQPLKFAGPCKSSKINFMLSGEVIAPDGPKKWKGIDISKWIEFRDIVGLNIDGSGTIKGKGKRWWDISCRWTNNTQGCGKLAPTTFWFENCTNLNISNINLINSPQTHVTVIGCRDVEVSYITIKSPGGSPNTDGVHLQSCSNVNIHNSNIGSGDDCISIGDDISNINITEIHCGPGHGISIGSLGQTPGRVVQVNNITVDKVNFTGTTNGARIKTWQVGQGEVRHIVFSNLLFKDVKNPIIIDQYYCNVRDRCAETKTGVKITDVQYLQAFGTSKTEVAINLNCSSNVPCTDIKLDAVRLLPAFKGRKVISSCNYAYGVTNGIVKPHSCLHI